MQIFPSTFMRIVAVLAVAGGVAACEVTNEDDPPGGDSSGGLCADALASRDDACPFPMTAVLAEDLEGENVQWIGDSGRLFEDTSTADRVALLLEGDACPIACTAPREHPCFKEGNRYCIASVDDEPSSYCGAYCGPATADECMDFAEDACS